MSERARVFAGQIKIVNQLEPSYCNGIGVSRDAKGFYYKLRFIDFYDDHGNKGNPKFEFQKFYDPQVRIIKKKSEDIHAQMSALQMEILQS